jgi:hypothetical protein
MEKSSGMISQYSSSHLDHLEEETSLKNNMTVKGLQDQWDWNTLKRP